MRRTLETHTPCALQAMQRRARQPVRVSDLRRWHFRDLLSWKGRVARRLQETLPAFVTNR